MKYENYNETVQIWKNAEFWKNGSFECYTNKCFWISMSDVLNFKQHLALAVDLFWFV